jgi:serine/threonine-protein kinase
MTVSLHDRVVAALGGQYRIEAEIGRGGMSVVYRALDSRLNRLVAIKVLPPELAYDEAIGSRFTREAQTSAQLSHAHIVPIYDVGERDGIAYFVMALVRGESLAALIERQPLRPVDEVRRFAAEIADALSYAHLRGVIHRDIKADNVLLDNESGRVVVTDFGIARAVEGGTRLTVTGSAVGTPTYMSPEQATGEREIDGRSDIYSLGVLAYQMLAGRVPFTAGNPMALLLKQVSERPRPIAELRPEAPAALCDIIERALAKKPEDRWPTAAAMREALLTIDSPSSMWRAEQRQPVRYVSPLPRGKRAAATSPRNGSEVVRQPASVPQLGPDGIVIEPAHLASLTPAQREDLRLWDGRVNLLERVKDARRYAALTVITSVAGMIAFGAGLSDVPPLVLAPIVPIYMIIKLHARNKSLRESGLRLRRVYLRLRSRSVLPGPVQPLSERQLEKIASREVLEGSRGSAIRRAAEDRAAVRDIVRSLSKADRALLPDIEPTIDALFDRVVHLATTLHHLDGDIDPRLISELNDRLATMNDPGSNGEERRAALLRKQWGTLDDLSQRRATLSRQLDTAGLALANLRLDLIRLRASGVESATQGASTATQEARVLSREIAMALEAAAEIREI